MSRVFQVPVSSPYRCENLRKEIYVKRNSDPVLYQTKFENQEKDYFPPIFQPMQCCALDNTWAKTDEIIKLFLQRKAMTFLISYIFWLYRDFAIVGLQTKHLVTLGCSWINILVITSPIIYLELLCTMPHSTSNIDILRCWHNYTVARPLWYSTTIASFCQRLSTLQAKYVYFDIIKNKRKTRSRMVKGERRI